MSSQPAPHKMTTLQRVAFGMILAVAPPAAALYAESPAAKKPQQAPAASDMAQAQAQVRQRADREAAEMLERMRQANPEGYEQLKAQQDQVKQIEQLVLAYRAGRLDHSSARKQLYPLAKALLEDQRPYSDQEIASLKARLAELEATKRDPERATQRLLDQWLGKRSP